MTPPITHRPSMVDLEAEVLLDPAITFAAPPSASMDRRRLRRAFLTGATGFVGAFLLDELLRTTAADVYCLVRANDPQAARRRVIQNLQSYGLWQHAFSARIRPVVGDLAQLRLGLSEAEFTSLSHELDVIYHVAGSTNAIYPYARLKATNVVGTHEVLRLAGTGPSKPVHYLSTLAVLFTDANVGAERVYETTLAPYDPTVKGGYAQSKWVADRLVHSAQERGLAGSIYRCVRVMGDSRTGTMNEMHDILPLVLKACVRMGKCPALDVDVTMVPVDYVSRAIAHLSCQTGSCGQAFHLLTPRPIPWSELRDTIRSFGYPLEELPYDEWRREVRLLASHSDDKHFYLGLLMVLNAPHYLVYPRPPIDTARTQAGLADTDIACPPAEPSLIGRYVEHWQKVGYFPLPPARRHAELGAAS